MALILFLTVRAGAFLFDYNSFEIAGKAQETSWIVDTREKDFYGLACSYTYYVSGKKYSGIFYFDKPQFSSRFVAEKHIKEAEAGSWNVYVNKLQPTDSRLQHNFPFKELIHLALALLAFLYFRWIQVHLPPPLASALPR